MAGLPRVAAILNRIAADVDELARGGRVADLDAAAVLGDRRAERRPRAAEPDLDFRLNGWQCETYLIPTLAALAEVLPGSAAYRIKRSRHSRFQERGCRSGAVISAAMGFGEDPGLWRRLKCRYSARSAMQWPQPPRLRPTRS